MSLLLYWNYSLSRFIYIFPLNLQEPPLDWEPPAKIPRVTRNRPPSMSPGNAVYQAAMSGLKQVPQNTLLPKLLPNAGAASLKQPPNLINVNNKRPNAVPPNFIHRFPNAANQPNFQQRTISNQGANQGMKCCWLGSTMIRCFYTLSLNVLVGVSWCFYAS